MEEGAARQRPTGGATLDRGDTLKVEKKVGAEWAHTQGYASKFREAAAAVAKAEIDAKIKKAKADQNIQNAGQLDEFAAGLQQLENEALQSSLENAHNIQQLGREVGSFRPRPGRVFQDSSGAAMWGAAMSLAAGAFQSERSGGPNTALEIINTAIKQDLAAQEIQYDAMKTELQANQTLYSQMRASYGDAIAARTAQSAVLREAAAARLAAAGNQFLPAQARAQAAIAQEKLIQQANADLVKAAEMTFTRTSKRAAAGAGEALISLLPAELQQKLVNASGGADLRLLAQFGIDGAEFYRQQAGRLTEEAQAEEAAGKAGEAALVAEGGKLDRAVAVERQRVRPTRPTQRGATDTLAAPPEQVVATEEVTEEALPGGEEEVQERAAVEGAPPLAEESSGALSRRATQAREAIAALAAERSALESELESIGQPGGEASVRDLERRLLVIRKRLDPRLRETNPSGYPKTEADRPGVVRNPAERARLESEAARLEGRIAEVSAQASAAAGPEMERYAEAQSRIEQIAEETAALKGQAEQAEVLASQAGATEAARAEAAGEAEWTQRYHAGDDKVRDDLSTFVSEGFGEGSQKLASKIGAAGSARSGLVADLKAGGDRREQVRAAVEATLPAGAWIGPVKKALSRDVSPDQAQSAVQNAGYALAWFGGAVNESAPLKDDRVMNASQAVAQMGSGRVIDRRGEAQRRVGNSVRLQDVGVAYRLRPQNFQHFTGKQMSGQVRDIEESLAGGGVDGMKMRLGTRPLTVNVTPQQYTDRGWKDVPGAAPVKVKYNVPVALASNFFRDDKSSGKPFVGGSEGLVGDATVDNPLKKGQKIRLIGSKKERAATRKRLSEVEGLKMYAGAMSLYGEVFDIRDDGAIEEAADGGLTGVSGAELYRAWEAARARGGFNTVGEAPVLKEGGRWVVNNNSAAGNALGLRQDGDEFSVTPATSDINIGPLSHFVGFMAPQRAEMELLRKGTSGEAPKIWNLIQAWRREGAQGPAAAAKAFSQFLRNSTEKLVNHYGTTGANAAMIYDGAIKALQQGGQQGIGLNELLEAKQRSARVSR
ncbi:MAG: hypothetical protein GY812_14265 [Actinomycetia bacterium]|nr:hypothetical protein [Actinomycetes bacterium]